MKPEEHLMQHYRYWTIPDLGLSEDERGYVEALRIGAEAISERDALKDETQQVRRFLRGCMNHAFDETPLVQVARDVSGEFHRNRYQIQQRNTQINEMREERDAMKAEVERLRAEKEQGISDAMECFATMGCPKHTGENTPPFDEFNKLLHGRCHICDVQRIAELELEMKDYHLWKSRDGAYIIQMRQRIAELEAELQANALTIDAPNIRFAELREPTNTEETES